MLLSVTQYLLFGASGCFGASLLATSVEVVVAGAFSSSTVGWCGEAGVESSPPSVIFSVVVVVAGVPDSL